MSQPASALDRNGASSRNRLARVGRRDVRRAAGRGWGRPPRLVRRHLTRDGAVFGSVLVEVENQTHLNKVIRAIRRVKGVMEVSRRESGPQAQAPTS
ncbi:MAG: hypothetical protein DMD67_07280 [Gemmatimonadetes bacterium]|nr:MAG: hypothetical protein DMD67_07280 [Gemmatimonadota bacterium]